MSQNRRGLILVDKWECPHCGTMNDPESDRCWDCGADTDGEFPEEEEDE